MFFTFAVLALIVLLVASCALLMICDGADNLFAFAGFILGAGGLLLTGLGAIGMFFSTFEWFAAEQKAIILNREYGTSYSQTELFFASDVINTVRELDRKRIEINGDIRRQRDPERNLPRAADNR